MAESKKAQQFSPVENPAKHLEENNEKIESIIQDNLLKTELLEFIREINNQNHPILNYDIIQGDTEYN